MGHKEQYEKLKKKFLKDTDISKYNRDLFKKFINWEEEKLKRINKLSNLDEANYKTLKDYPNKFRNVISWFGGRDLNTLKSKDIRKVYNDLEDGKIKNSRGTKFGDIRSYVNKMFKAKPFELAGLENEVKEALEFYRDSRENKEVRFINSDSFELLVGCAYTPRDKCLLWLAWDVGENINSLLKLQKKHFKKQYNSDLKEYEFLIFLPDSILKRTRRQRREPTLYNSTFKWLDLRLEELNSEDDFLFPFSYRQSVKMFDRAVKRSNIKCEPSGEKPTWKDLRTGMACYLFTKEWSLEDINLRLGHSPHSRWLDSYINYLSLNRNKSKKLLHEVNINSLKKELEETKAREKLRSEQFKDLLLKLEPILEKEKIRTDELLK